MTRPSERMIPRRVLCVKGIIPERVSETKPKVNRSQQADRSSGRFLRTCMSRGAEPSTASMPRRACLLAAHVNPRRGLGVNSRRGLGVTSRTRSRFDSSR